MRKVIESTLAGSTLTSTSVPNLAYDPTAMMPDVKVLKIGGQSLMDRGLLRHDDPLRAARTLTSLCLSGYHQQLLLGRLEAPDGDMITADAEAATRLFLRAYAA